MPFRIGDHVRVVPGTGADRLLAEAADLTGTVGDTWTDDSGERISVVYEPVQLYAYGVPAADFMPDVALDGAPF